MGIRCPVNILCRFAVFSVDHLCRVKIVCLQCHSLDVGISYGRVGGRVWRCALESSIFLIKFLSSFRLVLLVSIPYPPPTSSMSLTSNFVATATHLQLRCYVHHSISFVAVTLRLHCRRRVSLAVSSYGCGLHHKYGRAENGIAWPLLSGYSWLVVLMLHNR